jgi:hypothetical protein
MNQKQKICLWLGIIVFVLMGIFPPWTLPVNYHGAKLQRNCGYKCILTPPEISLEEASVATSIDFSRLCVQWAMVAVVTGGLLVTLKDKKNA